MRPAVAERTRKTRRPPEPRSPPRPTQKPSPERTCCDLARDVVFSWTKTARGDHYFRTPDSIFDCFFETGIVVTDNGFQFDFDAEAIELFGEPKAIGVCAIGRKQLRSDGDDFG